MAVGSGWWVVSACWLCACNLGVPQANEPAAPVAPDSEESQPASSVAQSEPAPQPPPEVAAWLETEPASGQGLSPSQIRERMHENLPRFSACFDEQPDFAGGLRVEFQILPDGSVGRADIPLDVPPRLKACMLHTMRSIRFPAGDKPTNVSFPFVLKQR